MLGLIDKDYLVRKRFHRPPPVETAFPSHSSYRENEMLSIVTSTAAAAAEPVTLERRRGDRRNSTASAGSPTRTRQPAKKPRRRHIDPTTCERDYRQDELDFMRAMDDYKCSSGRMFPTCSEVLEVLRAMGYVRLTAEQRELLGDTLEPACETYVDASHAADDFDCEA